MSVEFPKLFKEEGLGVEKEFLYLLQKDSRKKEYSLMRAKPSGVEEVSERKEIIGMELPIYLSFWKTMFLIGLEIVDTLSV